MFTDTNQLDLYNLNHVDLDPALEMALTIVGDPPDTIQIIAHPLVHTVYCGPAHHAMLNRSLAIKRAACERAKADGDEHKLVWLHERPYRADILVDIAHCLSVTQFSRLAHDVWVDTENARQQRDTWEWIFDAPNFSGTCAMNMEQNEHLTGLNMPLVVYRGADNLEGELIPWGMSWTTSKVKAQWFADRWGRDGAVHERVVKPHEIVMYTDERGEQEIVLHPKYLV